ncbi:MAG: hypothetical protein ACYDA1_03495 [Vulcanimicrobiaceae bacterium]
MKNILLRAAVAAALLLVLPLAAPAAIKNAPLHKYFTAGVIRLRIDKIETYPGTAAATVPVIMGQGLSGPGFVVVTVTAQNPSGSSDLSVPHMEVGFELKDGSQMNEGTPDETNIPGGKNPAPTSLHPKQHMQFSWVISGWTGAAPTKLLLKVWNASGYPGYWYRIPLQPKDVAAHT